MTFSMGNMLDGVIESARDAGIGIREAMSLQEQESYVNEAFREYEHAVDERAALRDGAGR